MKLLRLLLLLPICVTLLTPAAVPAGPGSTNSDCPSGTVDCCGGCFTPSYCKNHPTC